MRVFPGNQPIRFIVLCVSECRNTDFQLFQGEGEEEEEEQAELFPRIVGYVFSPGISQSDSLLHDRARP